MIDFFKRKYNNLVTDTRFSEILTGSAWSIAARVFTTPLGLLFNVIVARVYGAEVVGILAVLNSFLILASIFTVLGTPTSILRFIPEHLVKYSPTSAFKLYRKTQYMVICISLITGSLMFVGSSWIADKIFSKPHLSFYFALASCFVVFQSLMLLNTQAVRGLKLIRVFAMMQVFPHCFNLILMGLLSFFWPSENVPIYAVLGGFAMTGSIGWVIMEFTFKKRMQPNDTVHFISSRAILSISLPMFMTSTMNFIMGQIGVIMIGMFRNEAEVGYYAIAVKIATLTSFVLSSINSMAGPKFSELFHSNNMKELFYVAKRSAKLIFWTTAPISLGLVVFGKPILSIFFGNEFAVAYPALVLLLLGQFINSISGSTGLFMSMTGNQNALRNIVIFGALSNVGFNMLLIPGYGFKGAAVAAMISISFTNIAPLIYMKHKFGNTTGYFPNLLRLTNSIFSKFG